MRRTLVAVAVAALVACAGCSAEPSGEAGSSASDSPSSSLPSEATSSAPDSAALPEAPAAGGPKISGTGYYFNVPRGWASRPLPRQNSGAGDSRTVDSRAVDLRDEDAFADNINVIVSSSGLGTPEQYEQAASEQMASMTGITDPVINDRVVVAGRESAHMSATASISGKKYVLEQFYPTHGDRAVVVTFSFSPDLAERERAKVTDAVLASWVWTD